MPQYIDKAAVKAEIANLQATTVDEDGNFYTAKAQAEFNVLCMLDSFLNTLEVKEEVLDKTKLMRKCVKAAYKRGYDMGVLQTTNKMNHNTKEVDLEKEDLPISNNLTEEGLFTFEDGSQAIITKIN